jgi:hypothetical protein
MVIWFVGNYKNDLSGDSRKLTKPLEPTYQHARGPKQIKIPKITQKLPDMLEYSAYYMFPLADCL